MEIKPGLGRGKRQKQEQSETKRQICRLVGRQRQKNSDKRQRDRRKWAEKSRDRDITLPRGGGVEGNAEGTSERERY